jgi:rhamnopyranosyl-N-acetylglucosaminyl-diphospho-decaprenol beta-1,3/1,4-galactofuranosyltransferase
MKIASVIVTYNRISLLQVIIESLKKQTRKIEEIIVVNNGSTDGTNEWLKTQGDLTVINQENVGSSGGQHAGIKAAYDKGYDWIWCMDDDGEADSRCLELLIRDAKSVENCGAIGPTVLSIENINELAFDHISKSRGLITSFSEIKKIADENGILHERVNFFNGILISRQAVKRCGFPKKEMFIWGDELEYNARISFSGMKTVSTINALFYHPKDRANYYSQKILGKLTRVIFNGNPRDFYIYRNHFYVIFYYNGFTAFVFVLFNYLYFHLKSGRVRECYYVIKYAFLGMTNNFIVK